MVIQIHGFSFPTIIYHIVAHQLFSSLLPAPAESSVFPSIIIPCALLGINFLQQKRGTFLAGPPKAEWGAPSMALDAPHSICLMKFMLLGYGLFLGHLSRYTAFSTAPL